MPPQNTQLDPGDSVLVPDVQQIHSVLAGDPLDQVDHVACGWWLDGFVVVKVLLVAHHCFHSQPKLVVHEWKTSSLLQWNPGWMARYHHPSLHPQPAA